MKKTQQYKTVYWCLFALSILLNFLPALIYIFKGYADGNVSETSKVALTGSIIAAIVLCAYNFIAKTHMRSVIWILLLGIYACLDSIQTLLIIIAICTIIDEFLVEPFKKIYYTKWKTNKEIDARLTDFANINKLQIGE